MKKLFLLIATVALFAPASIFAQDAPKVTITEDENTKTIVEETKTDKGYVTTTTVIDKNQRFLAELAAQRRYRYSGIHRRQ